MTAGKHVPLLSAEKCSNAYDDFSPEPLDMKSAPQRQDTVGTLTRKTSTQVHSLLTPVITSPFSRRHAEQRHQPKTVESRLSVQVLLSCIIMFAEGFYATQLFPYGPAMTLELRGSNENLGLYTGLLYTAQSAGMLMTSYAWASISNRYGRRACLLTGLTSNVIVTLLLALSTDYWLTIGLRLLSGMMNSNLAIMRTALRETFQYEDADDTTAFSTVTVAFGASSVLGPSYGGLAYGLELPGSGGWQQPWSVGMLTCSGLYVASLVCTARCFPETAFLNQRPGVRKCSTAESPRHCQGTNLLRDRCFVLLLVMGGGHSYVFTGWEIVYPLMARVPRSLGGEGWTTRDIGSTFLVGSLCLMGFSLLAYPLLARRMSVVRLWSCSAVPPLLAMAAFPRLLSLLCSQGADYPAHALLALNYSTQVFISMLLGSGFISIQLLLNNYVSGMPNSSALLAVANSLLVSTQALVRALSPILTGILFNMGQVFLSRSLAFDSLAMIGLASCFICALAFEWLRPPSVSPEVDC